MATRRNSSSLGDWKGTVGTVVLSSWLSIDTMRSRSANKKKNYSPTAKQAQRNDMFKLIIEFLLPLADVIAIGFQQPKRPALTPLNNATSYHLLHAVTGDPDRPYLDLSKIKLSKPCRFTQKAWNARFSAAEGRKITVSWELNPLPEKCSQLNDRVILVFYNKDANQFRMAGTELYRNTLHYTYTAAESSIGQQVCCYQFLVSADGKLVSETACLGMLSVKY